MEDFCVFYALNFLKWNLGKRTTTSQNDNEVLKFLSLLGSFAIKMKPFFLGNKCTPPAIQEKVFPIIKRWREALLSNSPRSKTILPHLASEPQNPDTPRKWLVFTPELRIHVENSVFFSSLMSGFFNSEARWGKVVLRRLKHEKVIGNCFCRTAEECILCCQKKAEINCSEWLSSVH